MKKLKVLRGALIGVFVVAAACCIFTACSSDKDSTDNTPITEMTLSIDNVKRTYLTYQSFSTDGLEAEVKHESGNSEAIVASDLVVDYSAFDNSMSGEYDIAVSYTENGKTLSDTYKVEVIEEIAGLVVEKETVDYTLESTAGVNIDVSDVKVYAVDESGQSSTALSTGSYELKYYKDGEEIASLSGVSGGIYTIYAYRNVTVTGKYSTIDYECGAYVLCYVYDTPTEIELVSSSSAVYSQEASSKDVMSSTWTFTVTYTSGLTKTVTGADVDISGLVTTVAGDDKSATVTYSENCKTSTMEQLVSVRVNVTYTISGVSDDVYGSTLVYNFNDIVDKDTTVTYSEGTILMDTFTTVGSVKDGTSGYSLTDVPDELEDLTLSGRLQISQSAKLTFSMLLPGTVTIYGICGSSSSDSATLTLSGTNASATVTGGGALYKNTEEDSKKYVTFVCGNAGEYTLSASTSANILVIVIKYKEKDETAETNLNNLSPLGALSLENIDLNLPEKTVTSFGVDNSKKN